MAVQAIILCATPRSGSTLLCDLMAGTGVLGRPKSWFRPQSIPEYQMRLSAPDGPDFDARYLAAVRADGTDASGTFAMRLMWDHGRELAGRLARLFPDVAGERGRIEAALGPAAFVFLSRGDKVAQAVSRLRAEQSGLWHAHADGSVREQVGRAREPVYDAGRIAAFIAEAATDEARWHDWFARQAITPIRLEYERLASEPLLVMRSLAEALGRDAGLMSEVQPATRRLADARSLEWVARFRAETLD